ncbi:murein DD-endopeptidase MepM/ murein hydrolase activator NlpD [Deinobacterium chartae]|uniref:Murein DD-endopeptidase MepM/ murein hydrolase activator NlpD n=1 Tax=Deinobacterium chartae TaxID=521158 RepID=A0A841HW13_9DEIO|nr:murein DD-endopeptidase MepM/ murein hydrolase activator NlpD [Deinobacterium chartae]
MKRKQPLLTLIAAAVLGLSSGAYALTQHTVTRGETLFSIAQAHGMTLHALRGMNPQIKNPDRVQVGTVINLPGSGKRAAAASTPKVQPASLRAAISRWFWPLAGHITSGFGWRAMKVAGTHQHNGIDIAAPRGAQVRAARGGRVVLAGWDRTGFGQSVLIDHGAGWRTRYSHNSALLVRAGQRVEAGQVIARVGSTGISTGNHLDFRVYRNGKPIDPMTIR